MQQTLSKYIPQAAVAPIFELIKTHNVNLKIVNERVTRHGDYRKTKEGKHQITVNASLNPYRFLMTLIHEIAHLVAFAKYGRNIKPHGKEWKHTFQVLMLPFIRPAVFPNEILPLLAIHFKNPKATSDTDANLSLALKQFDPPNDKNYIFEIPQGSLFRLYNGKVFKRGNKRVKRYECLEVATGRIYLFNPNAEVEQIPAKAGIPNTIKYKYWYVYIMVNKSNKVLYIGITDNLIERVKEHKMKLYPNSFTAKYNCNKLIYFEEIDNGAMAVKRERQMKKWKREWKLNLIEEMNPSFADLSMNWNINTQVKRIGS